MVLYATKATPPFTLLKIISDSKYTINSITKNSKVWEDKEYIGIENKNLFRVIIESL